MQVSSIIILGGIAVAAAGLVALVVQAVRKKPKKTPARVLAAGAAVMFVGLVLPWPELPQADPHEAEVKAAYEQVGEANAKCTEAVAQYSMLATIGTEGDGAANIAAKGEAAYEDAINALAASSGAVDAVKALPSEYDAVRADVDAYAVAVGARIADLGADVSNGVYDGDDFTEVSKASAKCVTDAKKLGIDLGE